MLTQRIPSHLSHALPGESMKTIVYSHVKDRAKDTEDNLTQSNTGIVPPWHTQTVVFQGLDLSDFGLCGILSSKVFFKIEHFF